MKRIGNKERLPICLDTIQPNENNSDWSFARWPHEVSVNRLHCKVQLINLTSPFIFLSDQMILCDITVMKDFHIMCKIEFLRKHCAGGCCGIIFLNIVSLVSLSFFSLFSTHPCVSRLCAGVMGRCRQLIRVKPFFKLRPAELGRAVNKPPQLKRDQERDKRFLSSQTRGISSNASFSEEIGVLNGGTHT